ncbi:hypothetical protein NQ317_011070 [Molorchus minor]|uniref:Uncharacterized protein n=1 Tax=Molorchus minor TaxID=1323400 RepID=A0ABQ9J3L4_9CUCU|nr:hypothetical protein NQ317_011070 [Molorchus minor]
MNVKTVLLQKIVNSNLDTVGLSLITKTPGGSETEDSTQDLGKLEDKSKDGRFNKSVFLLHKHRCNTLPAKDLSKLSQIFTGESDYVVMNPSKKLVIPRKPISESFYVPICSRL